MARRPGGPKSPPGKVLCYRSAVGVTGKSIMRVISAVLLLLLHSPAWAEDADKLMGNWKLVSFYTEDVNSKQRNDIFGPSPTGSIGFTPGRFYALIVAANRKAPQTPEEQATAYRTMLAYTGKWRLEEGKFITTVD